MDTHLSTYPHTLVPPFASRQGHGWHALQRSVLWEIAPEAHMCEEI